MSIAVSISITGDLDAKKRFGAVDKALNNMRDVLQPVGEFLKNFYQGAVYTTEGQIIGEPWAELSDRTKQQREKEGFSGKGILQKTGEMQKSIDIKSTNTFMLLKYQSEYAKYHQGGTKKMPERVLLKLDEKRKIEVVKMISVGFGKKIAGN